MQTTKLSSLTSRVRFGLARVDITPPVGIYHRMWGASRHDRSTGVHKPLLADVLAIGPSEDSAPDFLCAQVDLVQLTQDQHDGLVSALSVASGVPVEGTLVAYSHTHAAGWFKLDRVGFPGGELIPGYLKELHSNLERVSQEAVSNMQEVFITYATGRCNMAANREYWDEASGHYVCGFNPDAAADDTLLVARVTDREGKLIATIVNYACHPTTLAWENTLISPDFVGAMREEVERATDAPCIYAQGAQGDLGPRYGFVGDTAIADQNGRWLAYAALSTLESLGPPAMDFEYQGPVISGATLGTWAHVPFTKARLEEISNIQGGTYTVDLPRKPKPDPKALQKEVEQWLDRQKEADERGDAKGARDYGARAERARRWIERAQYMPDGTTYLFHFSIYRMGDAVWVMCGGEPYSSIQIELRRRFPDVAILFSAVSSDLSAAYLMTADRYGKGLYQEEPSILAPGCLETLTDAIAGRLEQVLSM